MKKSRETIHELRLQGMTFASIGDMFGVKRQRIWNIFHDYDRRYTKTDKYKMRRRHTKFHTIGVKPKKYCEYCVNEQYVSGGVKNIPSNI